MSLERDKRFSDQFIPHIRRILAEFLISIGTPTEDRQQNTDLLVLNCSALRIGCRVRRYEAEAYRRFKNEVTFRSHRASGMKTELHKIIEGWGDFFFYGWGLDGTSRCVDWVLIDLRKFRAWLITRGKPLQSLFSIMANKDGSSSFAVLNITQLPADCILGRALEIQKNAVVV